MLAVLSPAKRLRENCPIPEKFLTQLHFKDEASELMGVLRQRSAGQLRELMGISEKLATLNVSRNFSFDGSRYDLENSRPAALYFRGEVYQGLDADDFSDEELDYCSKHLAILSGLYGLLRPFDLIQAYRLEMGTALPTARGKTLYAFWQESITAYLNERLNDQDRPCLINLASKEYAGAVDFDSIHARVIHVHFRQWSKGRYRTLGIFTKKARGYLARYMCQHQLADPEALKAFSDHGYRFDSEASDEMNFFFLQG